MLYLGDHTQHSARIMLNASNEPADTGSDDTTQTDQLAVIGSEARYVLRQIPLDQIEPDLDQPRNMLLSPGHLDDVDELKGPMRWEYEEAEAMADAMRLTGQTNPIEVWEADEGTYILVNGERRWLSAHLIPWATIEAKVYDKRPEYLRLRQLVDNLARKDLSTAEKANSMVEVLAEAKDNDNSITGPAELGRLVGLRKTAAFRWFTILKGPGDVLEAVRHGKINSPNVAADLAGVTDSEARGAIIKLAGDGKPRSELDKAIRAALGKPEPEPSTTGPATTPIIDGAEVKTFSIYRETNDRPDPLEGAVVMRPSLDASGRPLRSAFTSDVVGSAGTGDAEKRVAKPAKQLQGSYAGEFEKKRGAVVADPESGEIDELETAKRAAAEESSTNRGRAAMEKMASLASGGVKPLEMAGDPESASLAGCNVADNDECSVTSAGDGSADTQIDGADAAAVTDWSVRLPSKERLRGTQVREMLGALTDKLDSSLGPYAATDAEIEDPESAGVDMEDPAAVREYMQRTLDQFFDSWLIDDLPPFEAEAKVG